MRPARWHIVALLAVAFAAAVALGALRVLDADNTTRIVVAIVALVAIEVRRKPPPPATTALAVIAAGELGAELLEPAAALAGVL